MDLNRQFDQAVEGMGWQEFKSILIDTVHELLGRPPSPAPPSLPAEPPTPPQPAASIQPAGTGSQGQNFLYPTPAVSATFLPATPSTPNFLYPTPAVSATFLPAAPSTPNFLYPTPAVPDTFLPAAPSTPNFLYPTPAVPDIFLPAAPSTPCIDMPTIPYSMLHHLYPVGVMNSLVVYDYAGSAPPHDTPSPKKRKRHNDQDESRAYIKKPPNAFMLFLKEQRPKVVAEGSTHGSAAVNKVVGQRWKLLTKSEKAKYFDLAKEQKMHHIQQHPTWSSKDNYGKKRKRDRGSTSTTA